MGILTTLTRMWLLRSFRPFTFQADSGECPPEAMEGMTPGLYVHIPFCRTLCNFCPYCKVRYSRELCERYLQALRQEIELVAKAQGASSLRASSLYFGGGSPALAAEHLGELITTLRSHFDITDGIGLELHPDDVTVPILQTLKDAGVTRVSIGIQSFQEKFQRLLGRKPVNPQAMAHALQCVPFETVSMDFIFALPGQTAEDLRRDAEQAFDCGANHVAIYPFIQFTFTESRTPTMPKAAKRRLLDEVTDFFAATGCHRDSIWTFARNESHRYSSMTRDNFLGFGCSATTLSRHQFRINTFSVEEYCRRLDEGRLPTSLRLDFTVRQRMVYWIFWKIYTTRLPVCEFEQFFGVPLMRVFGREIQLAKWLGFVTEADGVLQLTRKGVFYFHHYENYYTLAYIDKMWGLMRETPFPKRLTL